MVKINTPKIIKNILNKEDYDKLLFNVANPKSFEFSESFGRYCISGEQIPFLNELANRLVPLARETFNSNTLMPTYTLFCHYEGKDPEPSLYRHKDDNACTYTLDMCVYQTEPWRLWVEECGYELFPNEALAYYGNDQLHWRNKFPNPETNYVAMTFFHFAEPDHWYFTKGPSYLDVIRNQISEEEWQGQNV